VKIRSSLRFGPVSESPKHIFFPETHFSEDWYWCIGLADWEVERDFRKNLSTMQPEQKKVSLIVKVNICYNHSFYFKVKDRILVKTDGNSDVC
jgi:hypothetical protein